MKSGKNQNVDYILINLMPHATQPPNLQKALQHRELYSAVGKNNNKANIKDAFTFQTQTFKKYGSGVYLYFNLIQMLFFTFLLISFNSLPIFLSNFKGNGLKMYGQDSLSKSLMKLSLGNQRQQQYQTILNSQQARTDIFISQHLIVLVDIINSMIFFAFLVYWKIKSDRTVQQLISQDALPSYYTLQIKNLPHNYTEQLIKQHFDKFGAQIAQISTVYNYQNVLQEVKNLIKYVDDYATTSLKKKQEKYQKIAQQLQKVRKLTRSKTLKPVVSIITFQDITFKKKIRDLYRYRVCPQELRYQGKMIKVSTCRVQPSSILWQNYHLQIKTQVRQSILISIILIFVLLLTLLSLFLANTHATSMIQKQSAFSLKFDYSKQYTYEQAKKLGTLQAIFVFCSKLTYQYVSLDYYYFCQPYFNAYKQKFSVMIGLSMLVVTINAILNWIICQLANYRRYKTKTDKSKFLILNIFVLYFINSGLLMLLIRVQLGGYSLSRLVQNIVSLPVDQFSTQAYSDFTRKWYVNIGSQIVMIYAVSLLTSPFIQIVINWLQAKYRLFLAKRAKTQFQMNQTLMDSQFDFETFYAMMLNACFFTMFHGNAIPILYLLAVGAFFCLYVASYIVFRYFSCKPVMFDHTLNAVISKVMCIAVIAHQVTSILYIYTQDIFPLDIQHHNKTKNDVNQGNMLLHKIHQGFPFICVMILLIVCTVNYNRFCKIIKNKVYKYFVQNQQKVKQPKLFSQVFNNKDITQIKTISTQQMVHRSRKSDYLFSYKMEDNQNYLNICYALKILSIFQPYFSSNSANISETKDNLVNQLKEASLKMNQHEFTHQQQKIQEKQNHETDRSFMKEKSLSEDDEDDTL